MTVQETHPQYTDMLPYWEEERDFYAGERAVKDAGKKYLPMTQGQLLDKETGQSDYAAYVERAVVPSDHFEAVKRFLGAMHQEPPIIELPPSMLTLEDNATTLGESLAAVLRRVNRHQLSPGRVGVLGDLRVLRGKITIPKLSIYDALSIRDWDDSDDADDDARQTLVVLDQSGYRRNPEGSWVWTEEYLVLAMCTKTDGVLRYDKNGTVYGSAVLGPQDSYLTAEYTAPNNGGATLGAIPFAFINTSHIGPTPEPPPLRGLTARCKAIYRGEADHRQHLFQQGQDTFVTTGAGIEGDAPQIPLGAGAAVHLPAGATAEFVGVGYNGLEAQRKNLDSDYSYVQRLAGELIDTTSRTKESGEALKTREAAQTTSLQQVALTGGAGVEHVLRIMAPWFAASPDQINIQPNLDFTSQQVDGIEMSNIAAARMNGWPISKRELHTYGRERGLTDWTFEKTMQELANEEPEM